MQKIFAMIFAMIFAVALGTTACKSREFGSETKSIEAKKETETDITIKASQVIIGGETARALFRSINFTSTQDLGGGTKEKRLILKSMESSLNCGEKNGSSTGECYLRMVSEGVKGEPCDTTCQQRARDIKTYEGGEVDGPELNVSMIVFSGEEARALANSIKEWNTGGINVGPNKKVKILGYTRSSIQCDDVNDPQKLKCYFMNY
jgi:hypothetical protein